MLEFIKKLFGNSGKPSQKENPLYRPAPRTQGAAAAGGDGQVGPATKTDHSEEQFRLLVAGVQEYAIFMLDPKGYIATWNAGAERIKGYRAGEIIGQHFSKFYPDYDVAAGKPDRELEIATATGKYEEEGWRIRKDGSRFWASVVITALRDEKGVLRGFTKVTRDMTERKNAEERARQLLQEEAARRSAEASAREAQKAQRQERHHREQLQVTLSSIGDGVIVTDTKGAVTFLNPVAEKLTGWSPKEAAGQPLERVFRIVNEETRRSAENPVTKVLRQGTVVGLANHTLLIARDGTEVAIDDSAAPIRGDEGMVGGVVLVFRDVTDVRRAAEARLRLAAIVESSDDAIISKNLDGIVTSWNQAADRLYGYSPEEIIGKPVALLMPDDRPDELPQIMERLRRGEPMEHFETVRKRKDGSLVDVSLTISPIHDSNGKVIGVSKIARDITAAKRREAELRFLAEASRTLAEVLDVPNTLQRVAASAVPGFADWCLVDIREADGSLKRVAVAHADPAKVQFARELSRRHPPNPAAPRGVWNVLRTGESDLVAEVTEPILTDAVPAPELRQILTDLGLKSYIGVPLSVRGKTLGVMTFVTAESGRRYDKADLRLAEDLAHRAAVAIENARLYAELKDADQRKDEFLAMLSHELRNPLAPIRNALHLMKMPGADGEVVENARRITERQVQHMVHLVDDLLDVSRIMRGRIELRRKPVHLAGVIRHAVETAQPAIDAQGQQLIVSLPSQPIVVEADATRLAQVISNLLHNAAKFSSRAGRLWLTTQREGRDAVVSVKDEGSGIAADLLPHIFDLFVQGDRSLQRSQGGLGIGLTVVRKLVELHGGTITANSEGPGRGSEFIVRLPSLEATSKLTPAEPLAGPAQRAESRRVLVVDDNVDAAESIAVLLRLWGHQVRLAHNGMDAIRLAEEFRPDVVLLDIGLPGMNGYDVARRLRGQPGLSPALLIAVTGYGQQEDRLRAEQAGFDHHLTKPVNLENLQQLLAAAPRLGHN